MVFRSKILSHSLDNYLLYCYYMSLMYVYNVICYVHETDGIQ